MVRQKVNSDRIGPGRASTLGVCYFAGVEPPPLGGTTRLVGTVVIVGSGPCGMTFAGVEAALPSNTLRWEAAAARGALRCSQFCHRDCTLNLQTRIEYRI
jgi:hypothetical protein